MLQQMAEAGLVVDPAPYLGQRLYTTANYGSLHPHDQITLSTPVSTSVNVLERAVIRKLDLAAELVHHSVAFQHFDQWPAVARERTAVIKAAPKTALVGVEKWLEAEWETLPKGLPPGAKPSLAPGSWQAKLRATVHDAIYLFGGAEEKNVSA